MATITVTTGIDVVNAGDGQTSFREAVAQANASAGADRIVFAPSLYFVQSNSSGNQDAIEVKASGGALVIDGDNNDDGQADIVLMNGFANHLTVGAGAKVTIEGVDFFRGARYGEQGSEGAQGQNGTPGTPGTSARDGGALGITDWGMSASPTSPGGNGMAGGAGGAAGIGVGGIWNKGDLTLIRVGFGDNTGVGGLGGNGGAGGNGAFGINGGNGGRGENKDWSTRLPGNTILDGGSGANGAAGGSGGDGGSGGAGGAAAGGIFNDKGATLSLTDVAFGGRLASGYITAGNSATGGNGGRGGNGGAGQKGGTGGNAGNDGSYFDRSSSGDITMTTGKAGLPGNGSNGGNGGDGGFSGHGGSAAGAIYNLGTLTGRAAVTSDNSGTAGVGHLPGQVAAQGGAKGLLGAGGTGGGERLDLEFRAAGDFTPFTTAFTFGPNGASGADGIAGTTGGFGPDGNASGAILTEGTGTSKAANGSALVYLYGLNATPVTEGDKLSFNIIRVGDATSTVTVFWRLVPNGTHAAEASDFSGGLASGKVTLEANSDMNAFDRPGDPAKPSKSVQTISIDVKADGLIEAPEGFRVELTAATSSNSAVTVLLGTKSWDGEITDGSGPSGPTSGNDTLDGTNKADTINGLGGDDTINGKAGNDTLLGSGGKDKLHGDTGNDGLNGGAGNDVLTGGAGRDLLTGGGGSDRFSFVSLSDSGAGKTARDTIVDFKHGIDKIDLSAIDAITSGGKANDAFTFIGAHDFDGAGEVRSVKSGKDTIIEISTDADTAPEAAILLKAIAAAVLTGSDFIL